MSCPFPSALQTSLTIRSNGKESGVGFLKKGFFLFAKTTRMRQRSESWWVSPAPLGGERTKARTRNQDAADPGDIVTIKQKGGGSPLA